MPIEIGAAVAAGRAALDAIKVLRGQVKAWDNIEAERAVLELQSQVNDLMAAINELKAENIALNQQAENRATLSYDDKCNLYWRESGSNKDGPFCPRCFDGNGRVSRMSFFQDEDGSSHTCHTCNHVVYGPRRSRSDKPWHPFDVLDE